jgi:MFS family permease
MDYRKQACEIHDRSYYIKFCAIGVETMRALFYLLTILFWFSLYAYQSNFTPYLTSIGATSAVAGLIIGSYGIMQFALRLPFGIWADRYRIHKLFIFIGLGFGVVSCLIFLFTDNLALTFVARTFAGINASAWVNILVMFSNSFDKDESVKAVGLLSFCNNTGQILGMQAGALLVSAAGYKSAFALALALSAACLVPVAMIKNKNGGSAKPPSFQIIKSVITDRRVLTVSLIAIVSQFITFGITFGFLTRYGDAVLHTTPFQNGILTVVPYIPSAVGALVLANVLAGKIKEHILIFAGMAMMAVFTLVTPFVTDFTLLVVVQTFVGLGRGVSFPLLMGLAIKHVPPERRGTAMGVFQSLYSVGIFAGPFFSGIIGEILSIAHIFYLCGGVCFVMAAASYFAVKARLTRQP